MNTASKNHNLTAKTENGNKHQQNTKKKKKKSEKERNKKPNKELKKGKSVVILGESMVKQVNGCEMSKKIKKIIKYMYKFSGAKVQYIDHYNKL